MSDTIPCSPKNETAGVIYFPRLCDKVRIHAAGKLPADYHDNLGAGFDLWTCQFLGVDYHALADFIKTGVSDEDALAWARENGCKRSDYEADWWSAYMRNRGCRDDFAEVLATRKQEDGFAERPEIICFMDYIDADEGRS